MVQMYFREIDDDSMHQLHANNQQQPGPGSLVGSGMSGGFFLPPHAVAQAPLATDASTLTQIVANPMAQIPPPAAQNIATASGFHAFQSPATSQATAHSNPPTIKPGQFLSHSTR